MHAWLENPWLSNLKHQHPRFGNYARWTHDSVEEVDWVTGAYLLVRKEVFETLGRFDERFFMYSEGTDWHWRMRKHGVGIFFEPKAVVTRGRVQVMIRLLGRFHPSTAIFFESLDYYELKNHGWCGLISFRFAMVVGCSLRVLLWMAAGLLHPQRLTTAFGKLRLHAALVVRQLTTWHMSQSSGLLGGRTA